MKHDYLNAFLTWAKEHGVPHECEPTDNQAARIDFETDEVMARITYWSSGHCDAEILDFESEVVLYQKHWDRLLPDQFDHEFVAFFNVIRTPHADL